MMTGEKIYIAYCEVILAFDLYSTIHYLRSLFWVLEALISLEVSFRLMRIYVSNNYDIKVTKTTVHTYILYIYGTHV